MSIIRLTRLSLKGIYDDDAPALLLQAGGRWMLPEKLPVPTGTAVNVHIEVAMPETKPYTGVVTKGKWYEQASSLRRAILKRRGEVAGDSVQDLHAAREARGRAER